MSYLPVCRHVWNQNSFVSSTSAQHVSSAIFPRTQWRHHGIYFYSDVHFRLGQNVFAPSADQSPSKWHRSICDQKHAIFLLSFCFSLPFCLTEEFVYFLDYGAYFFFAFLWRVHPLPICISIYVFIYLCIQLSTMSMPCEQGPRIRQLHLLQK